MQPFLHHFPNATSLFAPPFIAHSRWLLDNGCDGLNILGSTGEANLFDGETRRTVMRWAAEDLPRDRLMVGTGTPSLVETIDLTRHAAMLGYPVALVLPPYYYKPLTNDGLIAWYWALHEALGESTIEIYFYNYPQMTGITIPADVIARCGSWHPPGLPASRTRPAISPIVARLAATFADFAVFPSSEISLGERSNRVLLAVSRQRRTRLPFKPQGFGLIVRHPRKPISTTWRPFAALSPARRSSPRSRLS